MTDVRRSLTELVVEAQAIAGAHPCNVLGHMWQTVGGRACPYSQDEHGTCPDGETERSQPVYRCARCGEHDYGEPGGPGHADCLHYCSFGSAS